MKPIICILLVFFCSGLTRSISVLAQEQAASGSLHGTVVDIVTGDPLPEAKVMVQGTMFSAITNEDGFYVIHGMPDGVYEVEASLTGYGSKTEKHVRVFSEHNTSLKFALVEGIVLGEIEIKADAIFHSASSPICLVLPPQRFYTDDYDRYLKGTYQQAETKSTFPLDPNAISYNDISSYIRSQHRPPTNDVQVGEMVNYFSYEYSEPTGGRPFSITIEVGEAPWNREHQLVHIGLQGRQPEAKKRQASNLVFLFDETYVEKPYLVDAFKAFMEQLNPDDRISIVATNMEASRLVLNAVPGNERQRIHEALDPIPFK